MAGYDEFTFQIDPSGALSEFTLMLDLSLCSSSWWAAVDTTDATKGRVFKQDGTTRLAVDWIDFDDVAETGFARILWSGTLPANAATLGLGVRIEPPQAANSSVAASDTYGSDNAYDANWLAYYPLHDLNDRTANANNLTSGGTVVSGATGKVGQCYDLQFGYMYAEALTPIDPDTGITMLGWFNVDTLSATRACFAFGEAKNSADNRATPGFTSAGLLRAWCQGSASAYFGPAATISTGSWTHVAYQNASPTARYGILNADFAGKGTNTTTINYGDVDTITIGSAINGTFPWEQMDGRADDVQVHSTNRADEWIKHEYDQTNAPSTFWGTPTWVAGGATYTLTAAAGSFTLTGVATRLAAARQLPAAVGAFTLSGPATGLAATRKLPATAGTFTLTGLDAGLAASRKLPTTAGEFTLTGIDAGLAASRKLPAAVGAFTLAGIDAVLTYNGINSYTLVCNAGTFTLTGIDAALTAARKLAAATGTLTLTGIDAGFTATRRLPCDVRAYTLTGQAVTLDYSGAVAPSFTIGRLHTISRPPKVHTISRQPKVHTIQP